MVCGPGVLHDARLLAHRSPAEVEGEAPAAVEGDPVVVEAGRGHHREDGDEAGGSRLRGPPLVLPEIAAALHRDLARGPGLRGRPLRWCRRRPSRRRRTAPSGPPTRGVHGCPGRRRRSRAARSRRRRRRRWESARCCRAFATAGPGTCRLRPDGRRRRTASRRRACGWARGSRAGCRCGDRRRPGSAPGRRPRSRRTAPESG